ncbi:hypothetical protein BDK51DRAFT_32888 [Blyttiomyces helicus]|uniref:Potassium channel domain-containing protein n=1 Tax=Blyttiomyces helicus TaxID=388810 RepID=A0A4P9W383_9FUNG|nr:hypothetical protein BDK51DRAFT_32888 [Blyttiomyces helicus]|eukprot:RKO84566.1 hypothetical protein BDK51DRAFT_32888 [Blyttiomyces helicus]
MPEPTSPLTPEPVTRTLTWDPEITSPPPHPDSDLRTRTLKWDVEANPQWTTSPVASSDHGLVAPSTQASQSTSDDTDSSAEIANAERIVLRNRRLKILATVVSGWLGSSWVFMLAEPDWTYSDAVYFSFVTTTTIGYGDLVLTRSWAFEFWYLYVFNGVTTFAYATSLIGDAWSSHLARVAAARHEKRVTRSPSKRVRAADPADGSEAAHESEDEVEHSHVRPEEDDGLDGEGDDRLGGADADED